MSLQEIKEQYASYNGCYSWKYYRDNKLSLLAATALEVHYQIIHETHLKAKLEEAAEKLINKTFSMEEAANRLFGDNDFNKGNKTALENFRVHIKSITETPLD